LYILDSRLRGNDRKSPVFSKLHWGYLRYLYFRGIIGQEKVVFSAERIKVRPTRTSDTLPSMNTSFALFISTILVSVSCVAQMQNTATNANPAQPLAAAPTNTVDLAAQVAELKVQVEQTSRLLAECAKANAALASALTNVQHAPQPAPAQPQRQLYYFDGRRFVPVATGTSTAPARTATRGAPGTVVGVFQPSQRVGPLYYETQVDGRSFYSLAPAPR